MPKGPNGQKRPGDVIGAAIMVAKIAKGEAEDTLGADQAAKKRGSAGGIKESGDTRSVEVDCTMLKISHRAPRSSFAIISFR